MNLWNSGMENKIPIFNVEYRTMSWESARAVIAANNEGRASSLLEEAVSKDTRVRETFREKLAESIHMYSLQQTGYKCDKEGVI